MEYSLLKEINSFRIDAFGEKCRYHFKNDTTLCHHWGFQFRRLIQFQSINCMKCGGYLASNNSEYLTLKTVCNCHSKFKEIELIDLSDSVESTESIELIESNDLFDSIKSIKFFYEGDPDEDFLQ